MENMQNSLLLFDKGCKFDLFSEKKESIFPLDLQSKLSLFQPKTTRVEKLTTESYTLIENIEGSMEKNIEPIKEFIQDVLNTKDIYMETFYYPVNDKDSILVVNYDEVATIMRELLEFCDLHSIILSLEKIDSISEIPKEYNFIQNENIFINELFIRFPNPKKEIYINEGLMLFSGVGSQVKTVEFRDSDNLNSFLYAKDWYENYMKLINTTEYKKKRHEQTHGVLIKRNANRNRGCVSKVGYAIVGKSKVA
jgi:hypothetical protein